jgi:hypothetical protein
MNLLARIVPLSRCTDTYSNKTCTNELPIFKSFNNGRNLNNKNGENLVLVNLAQLV